jgi:hypothetical protein
MKVTLTASVPAGTGPPAAPVTLGEALAAGLVVLGDVLAAGLELDTGAVTVAAEPAVTWLRPPQPLMAITPAANSHSPENRFFMISAEDCV